MVSVPLTGRPRVDGDKDRAHNGVSTGRERGRERAVQRELKQLRLCGGIAIGIAADIIGFRDAGAAVDFNGITVGTGVGAAVEAVIEITLIAPGDGQAAHAGVRHAHGLDLGADGRDLNGRGIQKNGRMLRGGLQCRLLFRFLREGRNRPSAASRHRVSSRLRQRFFMVIFLSFL